MSYNFSDFTLNDHGFMDLTLDDNPHRLPQEQKDILCDICYESLYTRNICSGDNCGHVFHCDCLRKWGDTSNSCPLCRAILINNQNVEQKAEAEAKVRHRPPSPGPPPPSPRWDDPPNSDRRRAWDAYWRYIDDLEWFNHIEYHTEYYGGYSKLNLFSFIVLIMITTYLLFKLVMNTKLNVYRQNYQFKILNR